MKIKPLIDIICDFFIDLGDKITNAGFLKRIPEEKRGLVLISCGGGLALILLTVIGTELFFRDSAPEADRSIENTTFQRALFPPEELFLPDEPDFIPGVLLEREQRVQWTAEDAAPWWQDPLKNGEEQWRARIEIAIDELLERVP